MKTLEEMTVFIVGLGQIGGSIGMDLVQRRLVKEVVGFDKSRKAMTEARRRQVIHRAVGKLESGVSAADLLILATPIRAIIEQVPLLAKALPTGAICLDVASTKQEILRAVKKVQPAMSYVSGHPIAGNEQSGIAAAGLGKFQNSTFVLVPSEQVSEEQLGTIEQAVTSLGASPVRMSAEQHDKLLAHTSHLPYALALALSHLANRAAEADPALWQVVGGSFRGATRVAKSSPELTTNLLLSNRREVNTAIDKFVSELRHLQRILASNDESALHSYAVQSKTITDKLPE